MKWLDRVLGRNGAKRQQEQVRQSAERVASTHAKRLDLAAAESKRITALFTELAEHSQKKIAHQ